MEDDEFDANDLPPADASTGALSTPTASLAVNTGEGPDSPIAALRAATAKLKAQRSGLSPQQQIAALLIGYGKPTASGTWQSGVSNAAQTLMAQQMAAKTADEKRQDLITKYDLMAAHYGAQNQAATQRTQELADAAKLRAAQAAQKAGQGSLQVLPATYPGATPLAVVKGFDADGKPFVRPVPIGTPGAETVPSGAAPQLGDPKNPYPVKTVKGSEAMATLGIPGLNPDSTYTIPTAGPDAGKPTEVKTDALANYGNLTGQALLEALPAADRATVEAIHDGRLLAPTTGTRGKEGARLLELTTAAYPDFDASIAKNKFATRQAFGPSGKQGQNFLSIDTVMNHIDKLSSAAQALDNTGIPIANAVKNAVAGATGNSAPTNYNQAATAVSNELMRTFRGSGNGSTKDIEEWRKTLDANLSPQQQSDPNTGVIPGALSLVAGRLAPAVNQWNQTMGENRSFLSFISPKARETFLKLDPTYQLTDDDKTFLMQQEAAKRQAKAAPKAAPQAVNPTPRATSGMTKLPNSLSLQYLQVPSDKRAIAKQRLSAAGYDTSGLP